MKLITEQKMEVVEHRIFEKVMGFIRTEIVAESFGHQVTFVLASEEAAKYPVGSVIQLQLLEPPEET